MTNVHISEQENAVQTTIDMKICSRRAKTMT